MTSFVKTAIKFMRGMAFMLFDSISHSRIFNKFPQQVKATVPTGTKMFFVAKKK